jgi:orotidine-5'-phosphate decarboxylase
MTADRLIVALDEPNYDMLGREKMRRLNDVGVTFFKLGVSALLDQNGFVMTQAILDRGALLFLDLKLYDTRYTVTNVVKRAFDLGARFVTVHATPSVMETAMRAKPAGDCAKVLAVGHLTDDATPFSSSQMRFALTTCDGIICLATEALYFRQNDWGAGFTDKLLVCPGIRPITLANEGTWNQYVDTTANDHATVVTPKQAVKNGADYIVVGRPIWQAEDPVAAAQAIIEEMKT